VHGELLNFTDVLRGSTSNCKHLKINSELHATGEITLNDVKNGLRT
jgi:hypothetical protein